jgi:UDP-N-acetylenolpyruvoylglucosamine reductase
MPVQREVNLKKYNSFGIEAKAAYFAAFASIAEAKALLTGA